MRVKRPKGKSSTLLHLLVFTYSFRWRSSVMKIRRSKKAVCMFKSTNVCCPLVRLHILRRPFSTLYAVKHVITGAVVSTDRLFNILFVSIRPRTAQQSQFNQPLTATTAQRWRQSVIKRPRRQQLTTALCRTGSRWRPSDDDDSHGRDGHGDEYNVTGESASCRSRRLIACCC